MQGFVGKLVVINVQHPDRLKIITNTFDMLGVKQAATLMTIKSVDNLTQHDTF